MRPVRNSIKAVILRDNAILLTVNREDERGVFYLLPGGGQEPGETMEQALRRECREEIGAEAAVGDLLWVREFIGDRYDWTVFHGLHQVEYMFACTLWDEADPFMGAAGDTWQTGIEWVSLDRLSGIQFYPETLKDLLVEYALSGNTGHVYLGDVG